LPNAPGGASGFGPQSMLPSSTMGGSNIINTAGMFSGANFGNVATTSDLNQIMQAVIAGIRAATNGRMSA